MSANITQIYACNPVHELCPEPEPDQDPSCNGGQYAGCDSGPSDCETTPSSPHCDGGGGPGPGRLAVCSTLKVEGTVSPGSKVTLTCSGAAGGREKCGGPGYVYSVKYNNAPNWTPISQRKSGSHTYVIPANVTGPIQWRCDVYGQFRDDEGTTCQDWQQAAAPEWGRNFCQNQDNVVSVACGNACAANGTCGGVTGPCAGGQCAFDDMDFNWESDTIGGGGQRILRIKKGLSFWRYKQNPNAERWDYLSQTNLAAAPFNQTGSVDETDFNRENVAGVGLVVVMRLRKGNTIANYRVVPPNGWEAGTTLNLATTAPFNAADGVCAGGNCNFQEFDASTERGGKFIMRFRNGNVITAYERVTGTGFVKRATTNLATTAPFNAAGGVCAGGNCGINTMDYSEENGILFARFQKGNTIYRYRYNDGPPANWTYISVSDWTTTPQLNETGSGMVCDNNVCKIPECVGQACTCQQQDLTPTPPPQCGEPCGPNNSCATGMTCDTTAGTPICKVPECVGGDCTCTPPDGTSTPTPGFTAAGDKVRLTIGSSGNSVNVSWAGLQGVDVKNLDTVEYFVIRRYEKTTTTPPKSSDGLKPKTQKQVRTTAKASFTESRLDKNLYHFYQLCAKFVSDPTQIACSKPAKGFKGGTNANLNTTLTLPF